jgi:hypothetical protein
LVVGIVRVDWIEAAVGAGCMIMSIALQDRGHRQEPVPAVPCSGAGNALARIFLEQWITFPRFVFAGAWWRSLQQAA